MPFVQSLADIVVVGACSVTGLRFVTLLQAKVFTRKPQAGEPGAAGSSSLAALEASAETEPTPRYRRREIPKDHTLPAMGTRRLL